MQCSCFQKISNICFTQKCIRFFNVFSKIMKQTRSVPRLKIKSIQNIGRSNLRFMYISFKLDLIIANVKERKHVVEYKLNDSC